MFSRIILFIFLPKLPSICHLQNWTENSKKLTLFITNRVTWNFTRVLSREQGEWSCNLAQLRMNYFSPFKTIIKLLCYNFSPNVPPKSDCTNWGRLLLPQEALVTTLQPRRPPGPPWVPPWALVVDWPVKTRECFIVISPPTIQIQAWLTTMDDDLPQSDPGQDR